MWNQITIDVPDDIKDAIVGELSDGIAGVWEDTVNAPGLTRLTLYFNADVDLNAMTRRIQALFGRAHCPEPELACAGVQECDWTEEWKKSYTSFPIGDDFFVIPSWSGNSCPDDRLPIRIDPGQAFGTGTHETTQLMMESLERWVERNHVVLDVGTGSGILAIASRLLGASEVLACDIDPVAVHVARANIERNSESSVWVFCGSVESVRDNSIHLLLCNLTSDVLMDLMPEFHRILKPSGVAIFSGILNEQREDTLDACRRSGFVIHEEVARGEWLALVAARHVA